MDSQPIDRNSRSPTELDPQLVLMDWLRATQEFYQWYCQLDQIMLQPKLPVYAPETNWLAKPGYESSTDLKQLQRDLTLMLATLQKDICLMDSREQASPAFDRLICHTGTLIHWSRRIQRALGIESVPLG